MSWKRPPPRVKQYEGSSPSAARAPAVRVADQRARAVTPLVKFPYVRSRALLDAVHQIRCMHCGYPGGSEPAHSNWAVHGKCKAKKASDVYIAALCHADHAELDQGKTLTEAERQSMWWNAHVKTVQALVMLNLWPHDVPVPNIKRKPEAWE